MNDNTSRRRFLKTSAQLSAAAILAGCAKSTPPPVAKNSETQLTTAQPVPTSVRPEGKQRIRVGLVGCGGRGTGAADDCAKAYPGVELVAMGDAFKDRLDSSRNNLKKHLGEQYKVADDKTFVGLDAYQKVIDSDIDLVLLCTPPGFRPQQFKYAIEKSKHVFFEKPVAVDPAGVRSVLETSELATQKKLSVVTGTIFRHEPTHIEIIKRVHDGQIGPIINGQNYYNANGLWMHPRKPEWSDLEWQMRNWIYFPWLSGDHIVEQAVHRIDIQHWIMGTPPVSAYGMGGRQARIDPAYGSVFDHFCIEYEYPNGVKVMHMCRQQDSTDTRITQFYQGTKGVAAPAEGWIKGANPFKYKGATTQPYVQEHIDLIASILGGPYINEGKQIAESSMVAIMGRMSAYTGKTITWEQAMKSKLDLWPKELDFKATMTVAPVAIPGKDPLV